MRASLQKLREESDAVMKMRSEVAESRAAMHDRFKKNVEEEEGERGRSACGVWRKMKESSQLQLFASAVAGLIVS